MTLVTDSLPDDHQALKALVAAQRAEIERLKMMIAKLRRTQFGRSSEHPINRIDELLPQNVSPTSFEDCEAA